MIESILHVFENFFTTLMWMLNIDLGSFKYYQLIFLMFVMSVAITILKYFISNWANSKPGNIQGPESYESWSANQDRLDSYKLRRAMTNQNFMPNFNNKPNRRR